MYGTVTVTPLTGCTLMLIRLLAALLRSVTSPICGSMNFFDEVFGISTDEGTNYMENFIASGCFLGIYAYLCARLIPKVGCGHENLLINL